MKITFIDGKKETGRYFVRSKESTWYVNNEFYMGITNGHFKKKLRDISIKVVKQHNIFKTIRVLLHELGHVFIALFLSDKWHDVWDKEKQIKEYKNRQ